MRQREIAINNLISKANVLAKLIICMHDVDSIQVQHNERLETIKLLCTVWEVGSVENRVHAGGDVVLPFVINDEATSGWVVALLGSLRRMSINTCNIWRHVVDT